MIQDEPSIEIREPESGDDLWARVEREFFWMDPLALREIFDFIEERAPRESELTGNHGTVSLVRLLHYIWKKPTRLSAFALCYAPGQSFLDDIIAPVSSMSEAARRFGVSKEAVRKEVEAVQKHFGYAPRGDQRDGKAKAKMSEARMRQLT